MPYKDKKKQKEAQKRYYHENVETCKARMIKRKREWRQWFLEIKKQLKCKECSENHPSCLDFHHTEDNKEGNVTRLVSDTAPKEKILKEIDKCIVLCANCHRKLHIPVDIFQ